MVFDKKEWSREYNQRPERMAMNNLNVKRFYSKHKDKLLVKKREYRKRPEVKKYEKEYTEKYREKNKEHYKKYQKEYSKQYRLKRKGIIDEIKIKTRKPKLDNFLPVLYKEPPKKEYTCKFCNKEFVDYKKSNLKYCSPKCYHKDMIGGTPWNTGLTKETDERLRKSSETNKSKGNFEERYGIERAKKVRGMMSESHKGMIFSNERNEKLSNIVTEEYRTGKRQKLCKEKNHFYGKNHLEKTRKKMSAKQQGIPLEEWEKFISFEPYTPDFNERFKKSIRARDNYCCVICNKPQEELGYKLHVHHVDYDKKNSFPQNAVSLCRNNHMETNTNRKSWKTFFQSLLKERYGYEYTPEHKIILDFVGGE